jgi:hypothetical protein
MSHFRRRRIQFKRIHVAFSDRVIPVFRQREPDQEAGGRDGEQGIPGGRIRVRHHRRLLARTGKGRRRKAAAGYTKIPIGNKGAGRLCKYVHEAASCGHIAMQVTPTQGVIQKIVLSQ